MKKMMVLLVDDEELLLNSLCNFLQENNYHVETATNCSDAIVKLKKANFDLVITDLLADDTSGMKVLEETKNISCETCVFIHTSYSNWESAIRALRLGANDYLLKPSKAKELLFMVDRFFAKHSQQLVT